MVTIVASYSVFPRQETPKGHLWLSDCDQVWRSGHTPTIYVYQTKHNDETSERLRHSLAEILVHYYPVAGRLGLAEDGRIEVDCNAKGVTFIEAQTTKSLADYGDFAPCESVRELVPKIDYTQPVEEIPLLLVQSTRFHGGEGLVLGVAFSHPLADGLGFIQFINSWAKLARGETLEPHELPYLDRTVLKLHHSSPSPCFDHPELKTLPLKLGSSDITAEPRKKTSTMLLKLTPQQAEKLKKEANEEALQEGVRAYSRFEAVVAHIWRCASRARELEEKQPTVVRFNVDIRSRLIPPLPRNYFGNALAVTVSPKCYVGEIVSKPLSYGAEKVREATEKLSNEYVRSQLKIVLGEEVLDGIRGFFSGEGERSNFPFAGNPNLHIISWMSMAVYEADFGWGKPVYYGLGYVSPQDRDVILLSPHSDGSIIVSMHSPVEHLKLFKKFFYESVENRFSKI